MKYEQDEREKINKRIARNIRFLMKKTGVTYTGFQRYCEEKRQIEINTGNLSHRLNGNVNMDFLTTSLLCEWLGIDMQEVIWKELDETDYILENIEPFKDSSAFIFENTNGQFNKYEGDYYCYFHSTIQEEENIVSGQMNIKLNNYTGKCDVSLDIYTNQQLEGREDRYVKQYYGTMMIGREKHVCYCIVGNADIGECNFISFRHKKPNNKKYLGGMAAVSTISAGGTNVPTLHRMLISRKEIKPDEMQYISGNLFLNQSKIIVEKEKMEKCLSELGIKEEVRKKILGNLRKKEIYEFSERYLRSLDKDELEPYTREEFVAHIRAVSIAMRYNKISERLDENVVKILENTIKDNIHY